MTEFVDIKLSIDDKELQEQLSENNLENNYILREQLLRFVNESKLTFTFNEVDGELFLEIFSINDDLIVKDENLSLVNQKVHYE